jgi:hypothetical protein
MIFLNAIRAYSIGLGCVHLAYAWSGVTWHASRDSADSHVGYLWAWTLSLGRRGALWWWLDEWPVQAAWTSSSVMDYGNNDSGARVSAPRWYLSTSPGNTRRTLSLLITPRLVTSLSIDLLWGVWSILFKVFLSRDGPLSWILIRRHQSFLRRCPLPSTLIPRGSLLVYYRHGPSVDIRFPGPRRAHYTRMLSSDPAGFYLPLHELSSDFT